MLVPEVLELMAKAAPIEGQGRGASSIYTEVIDALQNRGPLLEGDDDTARLLLARAYLGRVRDRDTGAARDPSSERDCTAAIEWIEKTTQSSESNAHLAEAYGRRGMLRGELDRYVEAISDCDHAIAWWMADESRPFELASAHIDRGYLKTELDDAAAHADAMAAFALLGKQHATDRATALARSRAHLVRANAGRVVTSAEEVRADYASALAAFAACDPSTTLPRERALWVEALTVRAMWQVQTAPKAAVVDATEAVRISSARRPMEPTMSDEEVIQLRARIILAHTLAAARDAGAGSSFAAARDALVAAMPPKDKRLELTALLARLALVSALRYTSDEIYKLGMHTFETVMRSVAKLTPAERAAIGPTLRNSIAWICDLLLALQLPDADKVLVRNLRDSLALPS
ncbi:MAG: hypothetical protein IAG13_09340 [Deltaproteobacteria bacterium]|nr:hypothetical protein [Nannocystaceae bacterium]